MFGNIRLTLVGKDQVRIHPDIYNFDVKCDGSDYRNIGTKIGAMYAGKGDPYKINFSGLKNINSSYKMPVIKYEYPSFGF